MIGLQYYGTHICVPFILEDTIYDNAVPIVQEFASRLFKSLAIVDVRYFGDKNAKANKFRENILTVILECFCRGSIA